ncbi:MAG: peptidoglycan DD-metalloendopeptidase family protein [Deltaproteobacteria bacterium]|nr:peptidoglycan DD-metalloendopeptidase family protein [Deltaproteobacteria bacterium]
MRDVRAWPWLVGGGLAAYAWSQRDVALLIGPLPGRWVWPVPRWNGRAPMISDGFNSPRPGVARHGGVDIMFERASFDAFKPGKPNGSKLFVMPDGLPAVAASDGTVWSAMHTPRGFAVVLDHGPVKVATFYTHLEKLLVAPAAPGKSNERVRAGQPIAIIGASPLDAEHLKHLHFEVWLGGPSDRIDPAPLMRGWETVGDPNALCARNGTLVYQAVGSSGDSYPDWVRALKGKAGVYVIRDADSHEILYVGSSAGRLYDTLTRHFQTWRRSKGFWKGQYGEGHDPGLTYPRASVEVAVRLTSPAKSLDEEMRLIAKLKPRDNLIGRTEAADEAIPF